MGLFRRRPVGFRCFGLGYKIRNERAKGREGNIERERERERAKGRVWRE